MPYLIKGPVPTRATGQCPWCRRENAILHPVATDFDGQLGGDYICAKCLVFLDEITEEKMKNNPDVEVALWTTKRN